MTAFLIAVAALWGPLLFIAVIVAGVLFSTREPSPSVQAHERLRREEEFYGTSPQPGALDRHIAAYRGDER